MLNAIFKRKPPEKRSAKIPRRIRELEVITARLIRIGFAGQYHAAFHGRGIEFAQVREYQPGDDIRLIDWNVTARSGAPHVKEFVEERDLTILLAVDLSASMNFGSVDRRKIDLASELAAVLAYAALQNGDRVGLVLFSGDVVKYIPPRRGRIHVQALLREILVLGDRATGTAKFGRVSEFIDRVMVKRAVILFLSDFQDADFERPLQRLNRRHDLVALRLSDPREERFPDRGIVRLADSETRRGLTVHLPSNLVRMRAEHREHKLTERFRRIGIDNVRLQTAQPYEQTLLRFFRHRVSRGQ
jgi:uncharacterized protein (DUF58 family)